MKRLLYTLFLFISCNAFGQGFSFAASGMAFVNSATVTVVSDTYAAGSTYILFIGTRANAVTPTDNPTVSSGSLTLTKRGSVGAGDKRIIVYTTTVGASSVTTAITFTYAESQLVHSTATYSATAANINGFAFSAVASNSGTSANPAITLLSTSSAHTIGYFMNNLNPFTGAAESGWTEDIDGGNGSGPTGRAAYRRNSTTDNTINVTAASSTWLGLAIQYTLERRIISIQ